MPFVKFNVKEEIKDIKNNDPEFAEAYDLVKKESDKSKDCAI